MTDTVDADWSQLWGMRRLPASGVHVVVEPPWLADYEGSFLLSMPDLCVVSTTAAREGRVRELVEGRAPNEVFTPEVAAALGEPGWVVVGPSWHHYVDRAAFRPVRRPAGDLVARELNDDDRDAIERLRGAVGDDDWAEGGFGSDVERRWGIEDDGELVAMGNLTEWLGRRADIGLATHPAHRGRGLAVAIASAMTAAALEEHPIVSYRALFTNSASLRVASKLGFVRHGGNMAVRPPRPVRRLSSP